MKVHKVSLSNKRRKMYVRISWSRGANAVKSKWYEGVREFEVEETLTVIATMFYDNNVAIRHANEVKSRKKQVQLELQKSKNHPTMDPNMDDEKQENASFSQSKSSGLKNKTKSKSKSKLLRKNGTKNGTKNGVNSKKKGNSNKLGPKSRSSSISNKNKMVKLKNPIDLFHKKESTLILEVKEQLQSKKMIPLGKLDFDLRQFINLDKPNKTYKTKMYFMKTENKVKSTQAHISVSLKSMYIAVEGMDFTPLQRMRNPATPSKSKSKSIGGGGGGGGGRDHSRSMSLSSNANSAIISANKHNRLRSVYYFILHFFAFFLYFLYFCWNFRGMFLSPFKMLNSSMLEY